MGNSAFTRETLTDSPVDILSGPGALGQAPALLAELGVQRALLVCGRHVARLPEVTGLLAAHPGLFAGVFDAVEPDPSDTTIAAGGAGRRRTAGNRRRLQPRRGQGHRGGGSPARVDR